MCMQLKLLLKITYCYQINLIKATESLKNGLPRSFKLPNFSNIIFLSSSINIVNNYIICLVDDNLNTFTYIACVWPIFMHYSFKLINGQKLCRNANILKFLRMLIYISKNVHKYCIILNFIIAIMTLPWGNIHWLYYWIILRKYTSSLWIKCLDLLFYCHIFCKWQKKEEKMIWYYFLKIWPWLYKIGGVIMFLKSFAQSNTKFKIFEYYEKNLAYCLQ